jgi:hypothetical protein
MKISLMLLIVCAILVNGGIGRRTLLRSGIDRKHALFFFLCVYALGELTLYPSDDSEISAACILAPVWTFGFAYSEGSGIRCRRLIIPISIVSGALFGLPNNEFLSGALTVITSILLAIIFGIRFGISAGAGIPVFYFTAKYVYSIVSEGFGSLVLAESCLIVQLAAISSACIGTVISNACRTRVREKLYDRTI